MIWSSCFDPVPPIFIEPCGAAFTASMYSFAVLYGFSAFTQSTNSSSASIATGVRSFQLNGMPVASGVVKRLESVMMILCGLSARSLEVEEAFAAGAARLVDDDHRLLHQIVLGDDALDGAGHLIGAAAGAGGNDELDRAHRLPCRRCGSRDPACAQRRNRTQRQLCRTLHVFLSRRMWFRRSLPACKFIPDQTFRVFLHP